MALNITKEKGFTMLELLMVIIVVGLLASLAIPQYQGFVEKTRAAEAVSILGSLRKVGEAYRIEYGSYPAEIQDLEQKGYWTPVASKYWHQFNAYGQDNCYVVGCYRNSRAAGSHENTYIFYVHDPDNLFGWSNVGWIHDGFEYLYTPKNN